MRHFLSTTALFAALAMPLYAGSTSQADTTTQAEAGHEAMTFAEEPALQQDGLDIRASTLVGHSIYLPTGGDDSMGWSDLTDVPDDWEHVGEIGDILIDQSGEIKSVVLDIGGFLGIGEQDVSTDLDTLKFVPDSDTDGDYFILYTGSRDELGLKMRYDAADSVNTGYTSWRDVTEAGPVGMMEQTSADATIMQQDPLTADKLKGMPVIGSNDERVGEVTEIVLSENGEIENVIIDVGGFLGIGEKPVAVSFDQINLVDGDGLADQMVRIGMTQEQLEGMSAWNG